MANQRKQNRKEARVRVANAFIEVISNRGRHFFRYIDRETATSRGSRFELDAHGRIWFVDAYRGARIYTHHPGRWRGFTNGGTMRRLVEKLRDYIRTGEKPRLALGPWPDWYADGDPWGYGEAMIEVREAARDLGLAPPLDRPERSGGTLGSHSAAQTANEETRHA